MPLVGVLNIIIGSILPTWMLERASSSELPGKGLRSDEAPDATSGEASKPDLQMRQGPSGRLVAGEGSLVGYKQITVRMI